MIDPDTRFALERELDRVVDRLMSMPLARAQSAAPACRMAAEVILDQTRGLTDAIPVRAHIPDLGPTGLGAMIAVLGRDYLAATEASGDVDTSGVLEALVELRRSLP